MEEIDAAIIACIQHGHTDTLIKLGLRPDWIHDGDVSTCYLAAVESRQESQNPNRISILTKTWGGLKNPNAIKELFSLNGTGEVSPKDVVGKLRNRHLVQQAKHERDEIDKLIATKPNEVGDWLPTRARAILSLANIGRAYDPRPSAHKGAIVPAIMFRSKIPTLNNIFAGKVGDGGGYRAGWYNAWYGVSGHGKTTLGYTIAWDCISLGKRVAIISKENQNQVRARILWGLTHLTRQEIDTGKAIDVEPIYGEDRELVKIHDNSGNLIGEWHKASVRQWIHDQWDAEIEKLLTLWSWDFFKGEAMRGIISSEDPHVIICDYISAKDCGNSRDVVIGLGSVSEGLQSIAHETNKNVHSKWQISNDDARKYLKNNRHVVIGPYGSGMVTHAADQVGQIKRDNAPKRQHIFITKDRASNPYQEYVLGYDENRWLFTELPSRVQVYTK